MTKVLLEGRPGIGKSTVARRLWGLLEARGVPLAGFVTDEIREAGRRVGFAVSTVGGDRGVLAHVELPGPPRVGRYGVDLSSFERLALPALAAPAGTVVLVDELGKMELASGAFRDRIEALFEGAGPLVATVHGSAHPATDALKRRRDVELLRVTVTNRDRLPEELADRLRG